LKGGKKAPPKNKALKKRLRPGQKGNNKTLKGALGKPLKKPHLRGRNITPPGGRPTPTKAQIFLEGPQKLQRERAAPPKCHQ